MGLKASGGDGIPAELFQILKDDAVILLHSIYQQIWKTQQWPQDWKRSVFIIPNKNNDTECSNYHISGLISHVSKVMLIILQVSLQQYVNWELPDVQAGFRKGRGTRGQIANIRWIIEKAREFFFFFFSKGISKSSTSALLTTLEPLCGSQQTGKFLKRWEYQTTLPVSWETCMQVKKQVRTRHGTTNWFKIGKGCQDCILSPSLFNLYTKNTMRNVRLDEAQAGIKIAGRNINNLTYADDTTLWQKVKRN